MRVDDLPVEELEDLMEDLADIRHDLGKYLTLGARFLGPEPGVADLREALKGDLLRTARRTSGDETAWELWARLRPDGLDLCELRLAQVLHRHHAFRVLLFPAGRVLFSATTELMAAPQVNDGVHAEKPQGGRWLANLEPSRQRFEGAVRGL